MTIEYDGEKPARLDTVVVSSQHAADIDLETLLAPDIRELVVEPELADLGLDTSGYRLLVNPTGRFEIGGPMGDAGLTGRKIIVDTYGGMARHGGGAFWEGSVEGRPLCGVRNAMGGKERGCVRGSRVSAKFRSPMRSARHVPSAYSLRRSARGSCLTPESKRPCKRYSTCDQQQSFRRWIFVARSMPRPLLTVTSGARMNPSPGSGLTGLMTFARLLESDLN